MTFFKRFPIDKEVTYKVPDFNCFACSDYGIVHNSDGYLSNVLPGYDQRHDLAIICWCQAAYPQRKEDGSIEKHGFRDDSSNICNDVGIDIPKDKTFVMPAGDTRETLIEMYPKVFELCAEHGYNMTGRDHIIAYDTERGV